MTLTGIRVPDKNDLSQFNIGPQKRTGIGFNHELLYTGSEFFIQTSFCEVLKIDATNKQLKIQFTQIGNYDHYTIFSGLNDLFFNYVRTNYPDNIFKYSVTCGPYIVLDCKLHSNVLFFDSDKKPLTSGDIRAGDRVLCILKTKGLWVDDKTSSMKWNVLQLLKK
jgi:hypothetical protein